MAPAVSPVPEARLIKLEAHLKSKIVGQDKILLNIEPEAERLIARLGLQSERGVPELRATIERLVETPLAGLAKTGKLAKNPVWKAVHDEGGVYILPQ